jgi:hypothetical protein
MHRLFNDGQHDIWQLVMSFLPLSELLFLAASCRSMNVMLRDYTLCWFHRLSSRSVNNTCDFRDLLRDSNVVISGSFTLFFIFATTESSWYPEYLDVYVHQEKFKQLLQGLHCNGFTSVMTVAGEEAYSGNEVSCVVRASNTLEGHVIDVIVSQSPSPIALLFQCHSSLDMNYVSADTFFPPIQLSHAVPLGFRICCWSSENASR